jgi:hypothetical protein
VHNARWRAGPLVSCAGRSRGPAVDRHAARINAPPAPASRAPRLPTAERSHRRTFRASRGGKFFPFRSRSSPPTHRRARTYGGLATERALTAVLRRGGVAGTRAAHQRFDLPRLHQPSADARTVVGARPSINFITSIPRRCSRSGSGSRKPCTAFAPRTRPEAADMGYGGGPLLPGGLSVRGSIAANCARPVVEGPVGRNTRHMSCQSRPEATTRAGRARAP